MPGNATALRAALKGLRDDRRLLRRAGRLLERYAGLLLVHGSEESEIVPLGELVHVSAEDDRVHFFLASGRTIVSHTAYTLEGIEAVSARVQGDILIIELAGNITVTMPLALVPGLPLDAPVARLAAVSVSPSGEGLIWEDLKASVSVPGIMLKLAGTERVRRQIMTDAARKAASVVTEKRREAARKNGTKGGRPRKIQSSGG